ncbi:hypothetical protein POX_f08067 [Penicillium oxalicum]|nr:hypothetical protein POX_f08067 [Penicillium oxalicum]KAI2787692.1 hypothetical protein POX_f08067 [Penicillium oxalicum]
MRQDATRARNSEGLWSSGQRRNIDDLRPTHLVYKEARNGYADGQYVHVS